MKAIPPNIRNKLRDINQCQLRVKELLSEIEQWEPALFDNITDPDTGWTFAMTVDMQGMVHSAHESEKTLLKFLNEYKQLTPPRDEK